ARWMSCHVVTDLMAQHGGELGFGTEVVHQTTMDVDIPTTGRERVHLVIVEHEELEVPVCDRRLRCHPCTDALDVILDSLILVKAVELNDFLVFPTRLILLALNRGEYYVVAPGRRIGSARGEEDKYGSSRQSAFREAGGC